MKLKFQVPLKIYLLGDNEEHLNLSTSFIHDGVRVFIRFNGDNPFTLPDDPSVRGIRLVRKINGLECEIEYIDSDNPEILRLITKEINFVNILNFLKPIINRILRALRNWGFVYSIVEINPNDAKAEYLIRSWNVEYSSDSVVWKKMVESPKGILSALIAYSDPDDQIEILTVNNWISVEEAIQDKLTPPPEQEFLANAKQHLKQRNYRVAIVEAIICLEIVLSQFLKAYLKIEKSISQERINDFLTTGFGIKSKVSGLLDLVLSLEDMRLIELDNIRTAIEWRNKIVHKTGKLPEYISEKELEEKINSVLTLALLLGHKRDQINSAPMLKEFSNKLAVDFNLPEPHITLVQKHLYIIDFDFIEFELPSDIERTISSVAMSASSFLTSSDHRFDPEKHLVIRFIVLLEGVRARWKKNKVEIYK